MTTTNDSRAIAEPIIAPFTVLVDSREQIPFAFDGLRAGARNGNWPIVVRTKTKGLPAGDYTIEGEPYENQIAIERKTFEDLFGTLGRGRERFIRELERLNEMEFAAVVVEASWRDIAFYRPVHSRMKSRAIIASIIAFSQRFPNVHWFPMGNRRLAEAMTFRLLERFYEDKLKEAAA